MYFIAVSLMTCYQVKPFLEFAKISYQMPVMLTKVLRLFN